MTAPKKYGKQKVGTELKIHSDEAWDIAVRYSDVLSSDTRTLAAQIDVALNAAHTLGVHEGRAAGEVWDCSDCFEEGHNEGRKAGIEEAAVELDKAAEAQRRVSGNTWSEMCQTAELIRALTQTPDQGGES